MSSAIISSADASRIALPTEDEDVAALRDSVVSKLTHAVGRDPIVATDRDWFIATALAVRDHVIERWLASTRANYTSKRKRVYYLSLEFLIGRLLFDSLNNLGLAGRMRLALAELGVDFDRLRELEPDAALGNGGLGRLAACFMESMATLNIAAHGYGIRYDHGMFRQVIQDGWQQEYPEDWLSFGNPWEVVRPDATHIVGFGGSVETQCDADGLTTCTWRPSESVQAIAYDTPVVGWRGHYANTLRLWSAWSSEPLRLDEFNRGDHVGAVAGRARAKAISEVLYPSDETTAGQELRLRQEYFFTSASLQDLVGRHVRQHGDIHTLADMAAIQLNDTHPAIAVAELMRLLVDVHGVPWDAAWRITTDATSYTNHTLLPEALESWPVALIERLLPRHMQIIHQINRSHLDSVRTSVRTDTPPLEAISLIDDAGGRRVRMSTLAFLGSHKVNGVSALHTELMRKTVFRDLHTLYPERIVNKTNGITFRRWLLGANPQLARLLVDVVGQQILDDPMALDDFAKHADDTGLHDRLAAIRHANKAALARLAAAKVGIRLDPSAMFDVHIKRFHEYKRQLLNVMHTIALYNAMRARPTQDWVPRVKIFAGKAAATYHRAKLIIKLVHDVAHVINDDPAVRGLLKVVFLPDYNVSLAEAIIPATDISEQISTAGMEASGTGNMKLALNGALTIGTLDGANIEILERVGDDNIFIFGLTAEQAEARRRQGLSGREAIAASPRLEAVLDAIGSGVFSHDDPHRYRELVEILTDHDHFLVTADFEAFVTAQRQVSERWCDPAAWWRSSVLNTSRMGWFSSDRAIREYAEDIWDVVPQRH
ncbi:MAG TPA: glycogen/starch/alpha-glucan phosphorylase [Acetobacteraceae bacterium]|jgi:starch phosphorylase|nr:glycogen/starch/alpha-glucan phosphorylase [Acetobacteraceae bacterium]